MPKAPRPSELFGHTTKITTGCGNMYITVNVENGLPFEVFATLGKSGGCPKAQLEALTRCITLGLRSGVPIQEFIKELKDIQCPSPVPFPREARVLSCPDAIAVVLQDYVKRLEEIGKPA